MRVMTGHEDRKQQLIGMLLHYAPTGKEQQQVSHLSNMIEIEVKLETDNRHEAERLIERTLVGMLYDGLQYGNWPWTLHQTAKAGT